MSSALFPQRGDARDQISRLFRLVVEPRGSTWRTKKPGNPWPERREAIIEDLAQISELVVIYHEIGTRTLTSAMPTEFACLALTTCRAHRPASY